MKKKILRMVLKMIKTECNSCCMVKDESEVVHICKDCIQQYKEKK